MSIVTQKEIMNPISGSVWYEITFEVLNKRMLTVEEYHEINNMIQTQVDYITRNGEPKSPNPLDHDPS
jgi:hypothetical protein